MKRPKPEPIATPPLFPSFGTDDPPATPPPAAGTQVSGASASRSSDRRTPPPTAVADALALARGGTRGKAALETRRVRVSAGTAVRIRLLAAVLDVPVASALLHAVPAYLAAGAEVVAYPEVPLDELPGDLPSHLSVTLPRQTWLEVERLAAARGVRVRAVLDSAIAPHLDRLHAVVDAAGCSPVVGAP